MNRPILTLRKKTAPPEPTLAPGSPSVVPGPKPPESAPPKAKPAKASAPKAKPPIPPNPLKTTAKAKPPKAQPPMGDESAKPATPPGKQPTTPERLAQRAALEKHLAETSEAWRDYKPLAIGVHKGMVARLRDESLLVSVSLLKWVMARHVAHKRYWRALAAGGPRYRLDGTVEGEVTEEQQRQASERLPAKKTPPTTEANP